MGPECRGCGFQVLAAEFPGVAHQAHQVAVDHKRSILARLTLLAKQSKLEEPAVLAGQLSLLIAGAWVAARMFGPDNHARSLTRAARLRAQLAAAQHLDPGTGQRGTCLTSPGHCRQQMLHFTFDNRTAAG
jgi:hypothetical protein